MTLQIVEKSGEGLSRVYGVTVSAADLSQRLDARIAEISPQIQLKGFRPGKVPATHVRKMYGKGLMQEIVEQSVSEGQQQALEQAKVRPAASPDVTLESDLGAVLDGKADLSFQLAIEVMPEFEPIDVTAVELTRPVYAPSDEEVSAELDEIAAQNRTYEAKTGKAAKAEDGDMVVADFIGRIDGVAFEGGTGEDAEITIGSNRFIPGFEEQLIGAKPGSTVTVKVNFPDDYPVDALKGKPAEFEVTVKEVRAAKAGVADDALAERLGLADLAALKAALKSQLVGQYDQASRYKLKRALLDVLDAGHSFPLPPRMVEAEFEAIWRQVEQDKTAGELSEEDAAKTDDQLRAEYRRIAERRVRLGLVLAEIGRKHDVAVTDAELNQAINNEVRRYPGQEREVFEAFRTRPELQASLRAPIYEEKVVDLIIAKAKVADKAVTKDELFSEDELPAGYGEEGEAKAAKPAKKPAAKKAKADAEAAPAAEDKPAKKPAAKKKADPKA
ncbi:MAG TPA: trigger factor [Caulobacteraceae bacterium]|jgi:trigger factor|nr:trigger factor [Caulobacteraceae bacterium]